jgi:hypothetical protein
MANILTENEAATVLRCDSTDADMLALLSSVDAYIKNATGHDWASDSPVIPEAKSAARMLLVKWHEDPGMMGNSAPALGYGLSACLVQLEAMALRYRKFFGRNGAGSIPLPGASVGDSVQSLIGLVGATGDQSANFEEMITVSDQIQQTSDEDLSAKAYRVYVVPLSSL